MVTVAIISIMTGAVFIGFHSFFSTISVRNAPGYIGDIFHDLNQEAILREYKKSSVYFEDLYLLADSRNKDVKLTLNWEKVVAATADCEAGDIKLKSSAKAQLFVRDSESEQLNSPVPLAKNETLCVDPLKYKTREVIYELKADRDFSNKIRIFPLNLNLRGSDDIFIEANDYRMDILQPYSQKKRYKNGSLLDDETEAPITVKSTDGEAKVTFNLPKN